MSKETRRCTDHDAAAPRPIWHQGEGAALRLTFNHVPVARSDEHFRVLPDREDRLAVLLAAGETTEADCITERGHCLLPVFNIQQAAHGSGLLGLIEDANGNMQPVYTDERRPDTILWRLVSKRKGG